MNLNRAFDVFEREDEPASAGREEGEFVLDLFMAEHLRVYTNTDLVGVELGGSLKNVIAIAADICDGLGYGDNTKGALLTRGLAEIMRLGTRLGGRRETFMGLAGVGDLVLTCTGDLSRNRKVGLEIGRGRSLEEITAETNTVAEGVKGRRAVEWGLVDAVYRTSVFDEKVTARARELAGDPEGVSIGLFYHDTAVDRYDEYTAQGLATSRGEKIAALKAELSRYQI